MSSDSSDKSAPLHIELHLPSGLRSAAEARGAAKALAAQAWQCDEAQFDLIFKPAVFVPAVPVVEVVPPAQYQAHKLGARRYSWRLMMAALLLGLSALAAWSLLIGQERLREEAQKQSLAQAAQERKAQTQRIAVQAELDAAQTKIWDSLMPKLSLNLNPVFDRLEEVQMPQARLVILEVDTSARSAVLSYQLPSVAQVAPLADMLAKPTQDRMSCQLSAVHAGQPNVLTQWRCEF